MAEADGATTDYREAFRRAARPGYDPHEAREFYHPTPEAMAAAMARGPRLLGRLHGMRGTVGSAEALICYAQKLGDDDEICTFYPGYSRENLDFGVMAGLRQGAERMEGAIRFRPTDVGWWEEGPTR